MILKHNNINIISRIITLKRRALNKLIIVI